MKIICHKGVRIIYKINKEDYRIKTPIGVFNDINHAIEVYPNLKEVNRVKECKCCGKYIFDTNSNNNRVYCSEECARKGKIEITNINYYNKIFVRPQPFKPDHYTQSLKDVENRSMDKNNPIEYMQDDNYWGLGTGNLTETPANNFKREHKYIQNELKRLGLR